jgi:hypothetical protein
MSVAGLNIYLKMIRGNELMYKLQLLHEGQSICKTSCLWKFEAMNLVQLTYQFNYNFLSALHGVFFYSEDRGIRIPRNFDIFLLLCVTSQPRWQWIL